MAIRRARRPYRWLRRGLLLVLILVVVGLGGLYWFGRLERQPPPKRGTSLDSSTTVAGVEVTTVGQGFEYTHFDEGRKRFTLRALRTVEDREETVFLEGVDMLVFEEDGRNYELSADRAQYNRERQEAHLEGNVRLNSNEGLSLVTEGLDLARKGRLLTSTARAEIFYADTYRAVGDRLRVHVPEDLFLLTGNARVDNLPGREAEPISLRANRLQFERQRRLLRADGGVTIERPDGRVEAQSINAFLTKDLAAVRFLRARWDVVGHVVLPGRLGGNEVGPPPTTRVDFSGRSLAALLRPEEGLPEEGPEEGPGEEPGEEEQGDEQGEQEPEGEGEAGDEVGAAEEATPPPREPPVKTADSPWTETLVPETAELEGSPADPAVLRTEDATGRSRQITAGYLSSKLQPDGSHRVLAFGDPVLVEGEGAGARTLRGGRGRARILPDGRLGEAQMTEGVDYRDGEVQIRGEQGRFDLAAGEGTFFGSDSDEVQAPRPEDLDALPPGMEPRDPVAVVTVKSPRADLEAPAVSYEEEDGLVHARGGVSTVLREGFSLLGAPDGPGDGTTGSEALQEPVRVESGEAFFREAPQGALFRGEVRAWQADRVILAQWLRADEARPGDGSPAEPRKVSAGGGVRTVATPRPTSARPNPVPLTVSAEGMTYRAQEGGASGGSASGGELIYEGDVQAQDQGKEIACQRLAVTLDEDGETERLVATEEVRLDDPAAGKKARASRAVWLPEGRPGGGRVALFGEPAVVTDARGGEVKAPELTYELGTGRVQAGIDLPESALPPAARGER